MATIPTWHPPVELTPTEERLLRRSKKQPIFGFLRAIRHELFDEAFQRELAGMYDRSAKGRPPAPPALLAMATVLQAARQLSDQDAVFAASTDRAWQLVLGTLGDSDEDDGPFSQTALFDFRMRLIAHDMDRRLIERTLELAPTRGSSARAPSAPPSMPRRCAAPAASRTPSTSSATPRATSSGRSPRASGSPSTRWRARPASRCSKAPA